MTAWRSRSRLTLIGLGLGAAALIALDFAGAFDPLPAAASLIDRFSEALDRAPGYHTNITVGGWGAAGSLPKPGIQRCMRGGHVVLATQDAFGLRHVERWSENRRDYYQPGADVLAHVTIRNLETVPFGRWYISGFPSLGDLKEVLRTSREAKVIGRASGESGSSWIIECRPHVDPDTGAVGDQPLLEAFYRETFGRPWRVWFSQKTGLPEHVVIGTPDAPPEMRIGIQKTLVRDLPPLDDWKKLVTGESPVKVTLELAADVRRQATLDEAMRRIDSTVNRWRRTLFGDNRSARDRYQAK